MNPFLSTEYDHIKRNDLDVSYSLKSTLLVLLTLIYSGNLAPGRVFSEEIQLLIFAFILGAMVFVKHRNIFSSNFLVIAGIFSLIIIIQCVSFSFYPFITIGGFFTRLFIGYAIIRLVDDFPVIYVRVMVGLVILSFIFFIPYLLLSFFGIDIESILSEASNMLGTRSVSRRPLFLHTFMGSFSPRNAGMFWEPGAFGGYIILALIFLAFIKNNITKKQYITYFMILSLAILSTLSTMSYIALAFIPFIHYNWRSPQNIFHSNILRFLIGFYLILPMIIIGSIYSYKSLSFMEEKIEKELTIAELQEGRWYRGRVGSLVFDWEYIKERPLIGWGINTNTRYALHPWMDTGEGMGNGFSDFIAKFGIVGFFTWLFAVFINLRHNFGNRIFFPLLSCFIILLVLQGERFLNYPLFWALAFIHQSHDI
jgi:hypothetical protein